MAAANKIMMLIAGDPPASVRHASGSFADMIERSIGPAWSGSYLPVDARSAGAVTACGAAPLPDPADPPPAAVLITGSSASAHHREAWMEHTTSWLRTVVDAGVPVLGICFGHQLLAQAFDGTVRPNPSGREVGTVFIERLADDPLLAGVGDRFAANCFHDDTVVEPPAGATTLARSFKDSHQVLKFGPRCYGLQFHPEFDREVIGGIIRCRADMLSAQGLPVGQLLARTCDARSGRQVLRNFVKHFVK